MVKRISILVLCVFQFNLFFSQNFPDSLADKLSGKTPKEQVNYLVKIANNILKKNPSAAFELSKLAYEIATKNNDKNNEVTTSLLIARSARQIGKASEGLDFINKAINILSAANQKQYLAIAYNELGLLLKDLNKFTESINAFNKSINIYEELKDKNNVYLNLCNLAAVYDKAKQYKQSIETFNKAKQIAEEIGKKDEIALVTMQLGIAYANYGNTNEALNQLNKAKEIAQTIENNALINQIQNNINNLEQKLANKTKTEFEKEQEKEKEQTIINLKSEYEAIKQISLKSFEEIEKLKIEDQAKEYKLRAIQGEYEKQLLENKMKEQNLKLLEAEKKQKDAEILRQNETLAYQKRILTIIGIALIIVIVMLIFIIRLYITNKRTLKLVKEQKVQIEKQKNEIELINKELAHQNTIIKESIEYAKHIQFATLPSVEKIKQHLPNFFVFFKPRDVVSGDFYWFYNKQNISIISTIDCTGHGVPGAFMSLIANSLLNKIVKENNITNPAEILMQLNKELTETMSQSGDELDNSMDISICTINKDNNEVLISMAGHSCLIFKQSGQFEEFDGKDYVIGGVFAQFITEYPLFSLPIKEKLSFYFFSDGFADQIGGTENKKLGYKAFTQIIIKVNEIEPQERINFLENTLNNWKGNKKQVDDIIILGFTLQ